MTSLKIPSAVAGLVLLLTTAGLSASPAQASVPVDCAALDDPITESARPAGGSTFFAASAAEITAGAERYGFSQSRHVAFLASATAAPNLVGVHRLYNGRTHDFLYSTSATELKSAQQSYGYTSQGVSFYASAIKYPCMVGVSRVTKGADHRLVLSGPEVTVLTRAGWRSEGERFYVASTAAPVAGGSSGGGAPATTVPKKKPSAATVGVPAGTALRKHTGDITVTKDGTVLDKLDISGFVTVRAKNVTIRRSIVRGGVARSNRGLILNTGYPGLLIEDVDVVAAHPSVKLDGIMGSEFTARRVHVVGGVDSVKIQGDNVRIESSLLEKTTAYAHDPNQNNGPTHNDNVQILNGDNLVLVGNTIRGASNFAVLGAANRQDVRGLVLQQNWLDGGHCTVKLETFDGHALSATVKGNKFGPNRAVKSCPFQAQPSVQLVASGNVYETSNLPVTVLRRS